MLKMVKAYRIGARSQAPLNLGYSGAFARLGLSSRRHSKVIFYAFAPTAIGEVAIFPATISVVVFYHFSGFTIFHV